jgi:outer membrane receptor protein involved in Fe transport
LAGYRLTLANVAITPTPQQIVTAESEFPSRVQRSAPVAGSPFAVGPITVVDYSVLAANQAETDGFDFTASYTLKTASAGTFLLSSTATNIEHYKQQTVPNLPMQEMVNQVGNGGPVKLKGNAELTWEFKHWTLGWTTTYYGAYQQFNLNGVTTDVLEQGSPTIPSQTYNDAFVGYRFPDPGHGDETSWASRSLSGVRIQLGLKDVFNKVPPFDAFYSGVAGDYTSPLGDPRLRSYWLSVTKAF